MAAFRISMNGLLLVPLSMALAAIVSESELYSTAIFSLTLFVLFMALVTAVCARRRRPLWAGFAVAGWALLLLVRGLKSDNLRYHPFKHHLVKAIYPLLQRPVAQAACNDVTEGSAAVTGVRGASGTAPGTMSTTGTVRLTMIMAEAGVVPQTALLGPVGSTWAGMVGGGAGPVGFTTGPSRYALSRTFVSPITLTCAWMSRCLAQTVHARSKADWERDAIS